MDDMENDKFEPGTVAELTITCTIIDRCDDDPEYSYFVHLANAECVWLSKKLFESSVTGIGHRP